MKRMMKGKLERLWTSCRCSRPSAYYVVRWARTEKPLSSKFVVIVNRLYLKFVFDLPLSCISTSLVSRQCTTQRRW